MGKIRTEPKTTPVRPILPLPKTGADIALEMAAAILLAAFVVTVVAAWNTLPDRIPTHFNWQGEPDAFGGRANVLWLPAVALAQYLLLTVLSRMPHRLNFPWPITADNAARQYRLVQRFLAVLKTLLVALFFLLFLETWAVANGAAVVLGVFGLPLLMGPILLALAWYVWCARRAR